MRVMFWRRLALATACALAAGQALAIGGGTSTDAPMLERLVFIRHGEKPAQSLGQLDCQGLNRALALPAVLVGKYGRPDAIFAPDPRQPADKARQGAYDYVRPLATIEPTAIALGMPVDTQYTTAESMDMRDHLMIPAYWSATVFVAWEHNLIDYMVRDLVSQYGVDPATVPKWQGGDYDSLYVVELSHTLGKTSASFHVDHEGLDGLSTVCPGAPVPKGMVAASPAPAAAPASPPVPVMVPASAPAVTVVPVGPQAAAAPARGPMVVATPAAAAPVAASPAPAASAATVGAATPAAAAPATAAAPPAAAPAADSSDSDDDDNKVILVPIDANGQPILKPGMQ